MSLLPQLEMNEYKLEQVHFKLKPPEGYPTDGSLNQ